MIRVGKWVGAPSKEAAARVAEYLTTYFRTEKVWTRREHGSYVVAVRESAENTAELEEFRFNRTMEQRFQFRETSEGLVEIELYPWI